jgi:phage gp45-like
MREQIRELGARLRNLFVPGDFQKRYTDGDKKDVVQVKTHNGRVLEKKESFPYGFYAKAKSGRAFVFCQGGNLDGFEIFPVRAGNEIDLPELEEGDAALYTANGGVVILREAGDIEITAKAGGNIILKGDAGNFYIGNSISNMCTVLIGLIDEIKDAVTSGAPPSHTMSQTTKQKLEAYKDKIKELHMESA